MTLPNPAIRAARSGRRASRHNAQITCHRVAPKPSSCCSRRGSSCCRAAAVSPVTTGAAIMVCAMMIAVGVYINLRLPKGPLRHRKMDTTSPTTTGGSAMPVLTRLIQNFRVGNLPNANRVPDGMPINRLIKVARPEIRKDSSVISITSGSPENNSRIASVMPCQIISINHLPCLILANYTKKTEPRTALAGAVRVNEETNRKITSPTRIHPSPHPGRTGGNRIDPPQIRQSMPGYQVKP